MQPPAEDVPATKSPPFITNAVLFRFRTILLLVFEAGTLVNPALTLTPTLALTPTLTLTLTCPSHGQDFHVGIVLPLPSGSGLMLGLGLGLGKG